MKSKSQVFKVLRTDNCGEFTSHQIKEILDNEGILHQYSCPYIPEQNARVERN